MRITSTAATKDESDLKRKTITLPQSLWEKAKRIYKIRDLTFSSYVRTLIKADK